MIPYFEWRSISLGPLALQVWGFCAAMGVVLGSWFAMHEAGKRGIEGKKIETAVFWIIVWAFIGSRTAHVFAYEPSFYLAHPLEIFKIWHGGLSSFGGFAGAASSFFWQVRSQRLPLMKTADSLVMALPAALGCGRVGCFLIHDHPGTLAYGAAKWLAVNYPGGPRYDLGLLLGIFDAILLIVFLALARRPQRDGFYFALFMIVYGPVRFLLDFLRVSDARYFGLTPAQYGSIALLCCGAWLMQRVYATPDSRHLQALQR